MRAAPVRLNQITRMRVIDQLLSFRETRHRAYLYAKNESWLLGTVCGLLLAITGFGTVGLTMYWVSRRRRQIGMRRALGARRVDILRYFHVENFLIAARARCWASRADWARTCGWRPTWGPRA